MNKRLQQFLSAENISQSSFAESIGVARASVSHILSGRNKPGFDFIENMARVYPTLNMEWLITGKGRMYKHNDDLLFPDFTQQVAENPELTVRPSITEATDEPEEGNTPAGIVLNSTDNQKDIARITVFFSDGTFREFK